MKKRETFETNRLRKEEQEEEKKKSFIEFVLAEKFNQSKDVIGNFAKDMPIYYKQISGNKFLAFNIPFYGKVKNASFQTDFWEITALSDIEFLNQKLLDQNLKTILLGFDLEEDFELYKTQSAMFLDSKDK